MPNLSIGYRQPIHTLLTACKDSLSIVYYSLSSVYYSLSSVYYSISSVYYRSSTVYQQSINDLAYRLCIIYIDSISTVYRYFIGSLSTLLYRHSITICGERTEGTISSYYTIVRNDLRIPYDMRFSEKF